MNDLKPVAEIVDDPLMDSGWISDVQFLCDEDLAVGTKLYAIPSTHRVVSVEFLRMACDSLEAWDIDCEEVRAIIDNKEQP